MPLFDLICSSKTCNTYSEDILISVDDPKTCPVCGELCISKGIIINTNGIIYSNTEKSAQLGVEFTSNAEKRAYMELNNLKEYDKGSSDERQLADRARNRAEVQAKRLGYSDLEDRNNRVQREYRAGWRPGRQRGQ